MTAACDIHVTDRAKGTRYCVTHDARFSRERCPYDEAPRPPEPTPPTPPRDAIFTGGRRPNARGKMLKAAEAEGQRRFEA